MFYGHYRSVLYCIFNHWYNRPENLSNLVEKTQNKGYYGVQSHSRSSRSVPMESPLCDFLLVITDILSRTVLELSELTVQIWDILRFWATLWGLGTKYDVHLVLIGKHVVDFLLVLIELCSLGVTAESLRVKRDRKLPISPQPGNFDTKFYVEGDVPHQ